MIPMNPANLLLLLGALLLSLQSHAQCNHGALQLVSLGISENMSRNQSVSWRTHAAVTRSYLQIVEDNAGPNLEGGAIILPAKSISKEDYGLKFTYHRSELTDLKPNTQYAYRVGADQCWTEWFQFKTAKATDEPFSFVYISDVQHGIANQYPRVIRQSAFTAPDASLFLFTGDLTNKATDPEFKDFFAAGSWLLASKPVAAIPDNHEYRRKTENEKESELASFWNNMFAYPDNAPGSLKQMGNYYFDYQNTRFIMLNNKDLLDPGQTSHYLQWIESLLQNNPMKWTVVAQHQPVVPIALHRKKSKFYDMVFPLYEKYGVDLVLTGHDHGYSRGGIGLNGKTEKKIKGPVYIVSIAGSGMYTLGYEPWYDRLGSDVQLFQHIEMGDRVLSYKAYTATGRLYDAFTIKKTGGSKSFKELRPEVDEANEIPLNPRRKLTAEEETDVRKRRDNYLKLKSRNN
jgi:hypothetical protein